MRSVIAERVQSIKNYVKIDKSGTYSFQSFFKRNGEKDLVQKGGNVFTHCPFHYDKTPSFSFSDDRKICNCFSCGFGGTFLDFLYKYETEILGRNLTYYSLVDSILKSDSLMQSSLGYSTVWREKSSLLHFSPVKVKVTGWVPKSYLELAKWLKRRKVGSETVAYFVLAMQSGISVEELWEELNTSSKGV